MGEEQKYAFEEIKKQSTSDSLLVHYDPDIKLIFSCDAAPYGVGAVFLYQFNDGIEKPITIVSWTLAPAEHRFAHLEDHKPLMYLFRATKPTSTMASAWIQRWALILSSYDYEIQYRQGSQQANADGCNRLPLPVSFQKIPIPGETILMMEHLDTMPVSAKQVRL